MASIIRIDHVAPEAKQSIFRNATWVFLLLCDGPWDNTDHTTDSMIAPLACAQALHRLGAVASLAEQLQLRWGLPPAWLAAGVLASLVQLGAREADLSAAALQAVLSPESIHGICYLLQQQLPFNERTHQMLLNLVHYLLTYQAATLLRVLVEQHLVGSFLRGIPGYLSCLLVCHLLSSKGQETLHDIETSYELDVPLALAQLVALPVHVKLPAAPRDQQTAPSVEGLSANGHMEDDEQHNAEQAVAAVMDDTYTDVLTCRLLLQHQRLDELLKAFYVELVEQQSAQPTHQVPGHSASAAASSSSSNSSNMGNHRGGCGSDNCQVDREVTDTLAELMGYLMSRDTELQRLRQLRGDSIEDSESASSIVSSSSSLEAALLMPDETGVYTSVLQGLVQMPALPSAAVPSSTAVCEIEPCQDDDDDESAVASPGPSSLSSATARQTNTCGQGAISVPVASSSNSSSTGRQVVFEWGPHQHVMSRAVYKQLKHVSKLVHTILGKVDTSAPITALAIPHLTSEANCWVVRCLTHWVTTGGLPGFTPDQAAKLWIAADFLQVSDTGMHCLPGAAVGGAVLVGTGLGIVLVPDMQLLLQHACASSNILCITASDVVAKACHCCSGFTS